MPDGLDEIKYVATITHDTEDLFGAMTATVEIPVRRVTLDQEL